MTMLEQRQKLEDKTIGNDNTVGDFEAVKTTNQNVFEKGQERTTQRERGGRGNEHSTGAHHRCKSG